MENMDKRLSTKMGADKSAENTPNAPNLHKLSAQAQKFEILIKQGFFGRP